jgi:hypothetical protein
VNRAAPSRDIKKKVIATGAELYHRPMPDSAPTPPAPDNGRRRSRATVAESPRSHRRPEIDATKAPARSVVEDFPEEARTPTQPGWKSRWPTFAALAIAVLAVVIALFGWFRPSSSPTFTGQETADAKTNVCTAYTIARQAVVINTHLANPHGDDPVGTLAVAGNARLALLGGGAYLRDRLDAEPATPADLAKAIKSMAGTTEQLGINYLANLSGEAQDPLRKNLDQEIKIINQLCA